MNLLSLRSHHWGSLTLSFVLTHNLARRRRPRRRRPMPPPPQRPPSLIASLRLCGYPASRAMVSACYGEPPLRA